MKTFKHTLNKQWYGRLSDSWFNSNKLVVILMEKAYRFSNGMSIISIPWLIDIFWFISCITAEGLYDIWRQMDRQTETQTDADIQTDRDTDWQTQADKQRHRHTNRDTDWVPQANRQTARWIGRQTVRMTCLYFKLKRSNNIPVTHTMQADRQTNRDTDRHTDRQTETPTERHRQTDRWIGRQTVRKTCLYVKLKHAGIMKCLLAWWFNGNFL